MLENYIRDNLKTRPLLLMAHAVVGYPSLEENWRMLNCMQEAGVALVELQLPFSEPIADGPVFIRANQAALSRGMHWNDYFAFMERAASAFSMPLLFMGYYNSVFCMGEAEFCSRLQTAGGRGYIIADLPPEQAQSLDRRAGEHGLAPIHIMTPTNSDKRLAEIARNTAGFIYCVARKGVTGLRTHLDQSISDYLGRCRSASTLPLALGFGIRTPEDIRQLLGHVEIAIVGTACLVKWEQEGASGYLRFLQSLAGVT
jgi:tryptophan synthase alpha chain